MTVTLADITTMRQTDGSRLSELIYNLVARGILTIDNGIIREVSDVAQGR